MRAPGGAGLARRFQREAVQAEIIPARRAPERLVLRVELVIAQQPPSEARIGPACPQADAPELPLPAAAPPALYGYARYARGLEPAAIHGKLQVRA